MKGRGSLPRHFSEELHTRCFTTLEESVELDSRRGGHRESYIGARVCTGRARVAECVCASFAAGR